LWIAAAVGVALGGMGAGAQAQAVYKCSSKSYSEQPCSNRVVRTYDAPVPTSPKPATNAVTRQLPGESVAEFNTRRHRAGLRETDRDECARLDKRIPVEQARLKSSTWDEDIDDAQGALADSHKRFKQLRC
jgi:hypothetical protein